MRPVSPIHASYLPYLSYICILSTLPILSILSVHPIYRIYASYTSYLWPLHDDALHFFDGLAASSSVLLIIKACGGAHLILPASAAVDPTEYSFQ